MCQQPTVTDRWNTRGGSVCFSCSQVLSPSSPLHWICIAVSTAGHWGNWKIAWKTEWWAWPSVPRIQPQNSPGWRDLRRYNFLWEGEGAFERLSGALSSCNLETSARGLCHTPGEVVPGKACSYCKNCIFRLMQTLLVLPVLLLLVFSKWLFVSRDALSPLYLCFKYWNHVMNIVFSREKRSNCSSLPSQHRFSSPLITSALPCSSDIWKSSRGEQSTAGKTIIQFQWKHKLMLSKCWLLPSSGDEWRKQEWKWKMNNNNKK